METATVSQLSSLQFAHFANQVSWHFTVSSLAAETLGFCSRVGLMKGRAIKDSKENNMPPWSPSHLVHLPNRVSFLTLFYFTFSSCKPRACSSTVQLQVLGESGSSGMRATFYLRLGGSHEAGERLGSFAHVGVKGPFCLAGSRGA